MRFISNGDYLLPLSFPVYWAQHVYTWSYERGAANPDGIMRLPGRLIDIAVFAIFGNLGLGYFYVLSCLVIAFLAFLWFTRSFLEVGRWGTAILGALFFALNPIFLGNLSKVGLILAVAMLPLALTAIKQGFTHKRFSFFLLAILAFNISLIHPFTFTVNILVGLGYAAYLAYRHGPFIRDNAWKFALLGVVTLLLNAYFILPLASMRTLDKSALSDTVAATPVDYTSLVDVANTGDIFTGLSLSKGVLKDYEFYGAMTWPFYFLGVFMFYSLLFWIYIHVEKRANPHERRRFLLAIGVFLALLVLATASYLYADVLIKFLIGLPGGWMFRSPLKWQLYMPVALFAALVIALKYVQNSWRLKLLYAAFGFSFVLMNGYLFTQIYERLLTPKTVTYFSALADIDMQHKNLLVADSGTCMTVAREYPSIATELNQVLISKTVQVKHAQAGQLDAVHLGQYDFVLGCKGTLDKKLLTEQFAFTPETTFVEGVYELYKNTRPSPYVGAVSDIFALQESAGLGGKYLLANETLKQPFIFISTPTTLPVTGMQGIFDDLSPPNIADSTIRSTVEPIAPGLQKLFVKNSAKLRYKKEGSTIIFSTTPTFDMQKVPEDEPLSIHLPAGKNVEVTYRDPSFSYQNLISNPSLEQGLWQETVGDCNNYDDQASLSMELKSGDATDGEKSLALGARSHIACTGPEDIATEPGAHYLLSFDYRTDGGRYAGYYAGFDNPEQTSAAARLDDTEGAWQSFNTEIVAPEGTEKIQLLLYAYPDGAPGQTGTAYYDNLKLIKIPDITNHFYLVSEHQTSQPSAPRVEFKKSDPTRTKVQIRGAGETFFLTTKESYHDLWQLRTNGGQVLPNHLRINGTMNGWYVEPEKLCKQTKNVCAQQPDGSYDFDLVMEFTPQRWFYLGSIVSVITLAIVIVFVGYDLWRHHRQEKGARR